MLWRQFISYLLWKNHWTLSSLIPSHTIKDLSSKFCVVIYPCYFWPFYVFTFNFVPILTKWFHNVWYTSLNRRGLITSTDSKERSYTQNDPKKQEQNVSVSQVKSENEYAIPKINMLHNLSCCETRFRLLCCWYLLDSSLNLVFRQHKLHNIFIFGMAYWTA